MSNNKNIIERLARLKVETELIQKELKYRKLDTDDDAGYDALHCINQALNCITDTVGYIDTCINCLMQTNIKGE